MTGITMGVLAYNEKKIKTEKYKKKEKIGSILESKASDVNE